MKKISLPVFLSLMLLSGLFIPSAEAYNPEGYDKFINYIQAMARRSGVKERTLHEAFRNSKFNYKVVVLDTKQPERSKGPGFQKYKTRVVCATRINEAQAKLNSNRKLLEDIESEYGVEKEILVSLWGVESGFGKIMGNFNVVDSLTSLAYDGRRRQFFQNELIKALVILDQKHVDITHFKGSWAGAFGQVQFMPSTFMNYAVDHDDDGKKDLWYNNGDALASAANYLSSIGWQPNIGWGKRVILPTYFNRKYMGLDHAMPIHKWRQLGLKYSDGSNIPNLSHNAAVIDPDGNYGNNREVYLVTDNFKRIMEWNRSSYFATSIGLIADSIK